MKNKADFSDIDIFSRRGFFDVPDMRLVKFLLENGIPLQVKNKPRRHPQSKYNPGALDYVCGNKKIDVKTIKQLIEWGADVNRSNGSFSLLHSMILGLNDRYEKKFQTRSLEISKLLIQAGADILDTTEYGSNPLNSVIGNKNLDLIKFMFKTTKLNIPKDPRSKNLIRNAVSSGKKEILQFLISKGLKEVNTEDDRKWTPLHHAITKLYPRTVISEFIEKYDPNEMKEIIKILLKNGANANAKTYKHSTPLHYAAKADLPEVIEIILSHGADVYEKGKFGFTALHYAANHSCLNSLAFLLQKGFDINQKDDFGFTPLHHASFYGKTKTVEFLIQKGADCNLVDNYGNTPLHYAAREGRLSQIDKENPKPQLSKIPTLKVETVMLLIKKGAQVNVKNNKGVTPIAFARSRGHREIAELLRKKL